MAGFLIGFFVCALVFICIVYGLILLLAANVSSASKEEIGAWTDELRCALLEINESGKAKKIAKR